MNEENTLLFTISPHYTSVLQPHCVGINKSLEDLLKEAAFDWRWERFDNLHRTNKLPATKRKDVLNWLKNIWEAFSPSIVQNSFTGSGYYYEDNFDYNGDTASDSDVD